MALCFNVINNLKKKTTRFVRVILPHHMMSLVLSYLSCYFHVMYYRYKYSKFINKGYNNQMEWKTSYSHSLLYTFSGLNSYLIFFK